MSKTEQVRAAMIAAMKSHDKERKDALTILLSALKNKAIDKREELTEIEENEIVLKEIRQAKETIEMTPPDREAIHRECEHRIAIYEEFAPKMMDDEAIRTVIVDVLAELGIENPAPKDKGTIMKVLMPRVKGKADGKRVNEILAESMNA